MQNAEFPLYRRYAGTDTWFEILSPSTFRELKLMLTHFAISTFEARILPDRNYIYDLIHCAQSGIIAVDASEFHSTLAHAQAHLQEIKI